MFNPAINYRNQKISYRLLNRLNTNKALTKYKIKQPKYVFEFGYMIQCLAFDELLFHDVRANVLK